MLGWTFASRGYTTLPVHKLSSVTTATGPAPTVLAANVVRTGVSN